MMTPQDSFENYTKKKSPLGPEKDKITPKLGRNQMSKLKERSKKIVASYTQFFNLISPPN